MAGNHIQLITDGTAYLPVSRLRELGVISLPIVAKIGGQLYMYDQQTYGHLDLLREMKRVRHPVEIVGPAPDDFRAVFERTLYRTNRMVLILSSRHLSPVVRNAQIAARDFMGRCDITILDSQTVSVGLGLLVERAGELLLQGELPLPEIVRRIRGMMPHIYVVIVSHTLDYLYRSRKLSAMQAVLGSILDIHPFMEMEEGDILPLEKSRRSDKALDKLLEFASEFLQMRKMVIFQSQPEPSDEVMRLHSRLEQLLPNQEVPIIAYDPIVASFVGPDAVGLVIYEGMA